MKNKMLFLAVAALIMLSGCAGKSKKSNDKTLVIYYSQTGATKVVAEEVWKNLNCDIAIIEAETPYDGDYNATNERWRSELNNNTKVAIKPVTVNLDDYKTIFLGFPIWGGTYASPAATFLADNSLADKNIITFATFGSGGIDAATKDVSKSQPNATVTKGIGIRNARISKAPTEVQRFLRENGYLSGDFEPLPEYSEVVAVSESDVTLFDEACGNYQFPLGTPVSVAKRTTSEGTDYKFDVRSQSQDGKTSLSTIYVTVANGEKPEFTEVVRH